MLDQGTSHQCFDNIVFGRQQTKATRFIAIYSHIDLRVQCVDVVDRILLACSNVHATLFVCCETSLLGAALSWVLNCGENLIVSFILVDNGGLGNEVEAARGEHAPVEVSGGCVRLAKLVFIKKYGMCT
jgi:ATP-dependent protease Clp ATPase subunit